MDFQSLASELLARSESLCRDWLPNGRKSGHEYKTGDLQDSKGDSLSINLNTGQWCDFATGESGGDLISLYAAIHGMNQADAYRALADEPLPQQSRPADKPADSLRIILPVPDSVEPPSMRHPALGKPSASWQYLTADRETLGYIARYDPPNERKQIVPWVWADGKGWTMRQFPEPRPLYGLEFSDRERILIVEGEKSAEAARKFVSSKYAVVTWPGGSNALHKADFSPLYGKPILIWPDADQAGWKAANEVAGLLRAHCPEVKIIDTADMPDGWDAADATFTTNQEFIEWAKPRVKAFGYEPVNKPQPPVEFLDQPIDLFKALHIPELKREFLPDIISDYAFDQAEIVGTDPAMIALGCIVAAAAAAHDGIQVQPGQNNLRWRESARLWGGLVGEPSVKKSPAMSRAVSHLRKIDIELAENESEINRKHAIDQKIYEKQEKQYIDQTSKGEYGQLPDKPEKPEIPRLIVEDSTVEKLSEIMAVNPRGILSIADELSGWFGAMDAYKQGAGGKDRANWLEAYNGGARRIDRVGRGSFLVPNWSVCMLGGIQPDTMRKISENMPADGLLQRFMLVVGKAGKPGSDRVPNLKAQDAYRDCIDHIFKLQPSETPIRFSAGATEWHNKIVAFAYDAIGLGVLPSGLTSHLGKWEGLSPRLMLTFHIIECAVNRKYPTAEISEATARKVHGFMVDFLFGHQLAFYMDVLGDNGYTEAVRWIGGYILAHDKTELTTRELTQGYNWWRGARDWQRSLVIRRLIDFGWLKPKLKDSFKELPNSLAVNPMVHDVFKEQRAVEVRRRSHAMAVIKEKVGRG